MSEIKQIKVSDFIADPGHLDILQEYAKESANPDMPPVNANMELYGKLEQIGMLKILGAYESGLLIGCTTVLITLNPHYNQTIGTVESFFVKEQHRKSGIGLRLLQEAEKITKESGAVALFLSARVDSDLEKVMSSFKNYKKTNTIFFKKLI